MPTVKIQGIPPYDGEYEIPESLNLGELREIKQISGIPAGKLQEAFEDGDTDVLVAMTAVALRRAGHNVQLDALWAAGADNFTFAEDPGREDEDRPPAKATSGGSLSEPGAVAKPNDENEPSGSNGTDGGDHSPETQDPIGVPSSEMPVAFGPVT